jgi:hypothetical protein
VQPNSGNFTPTGKKEIAEGKKSDIACVRERHFVHDVACGE